MMQRMTLRMPRTPLVLEDRPEPRPGPGEIALRIEACGVCRTDLHVVDGELPNPKLPVTPGHEIVGHVEAVGAGVAGFASATASVCPGSGVRAATVPYAALDTKTCATIRYSPDTRATADSRRMSSRTRLTRFRWTPPPTRWRSRRCFAPASSVGGR